MLVATVILLSTICDIVRSSELHPIAPAGVAPVVTAASSQYFERTFNRLVAAPALQPVIPVAPAPPIIVDAKTQTTITPVIPTNPPQPIPADPNVAIAIATAHAAAPVATILLPPYPFGLPPTFGFIPSAPSFNVPSENPNKESTTQKTSTTVRQPTTTTERDLEVAPFPSNNDNSFAQPLPSNENVNFRQYLAPPLPQQPLPQSAGPFQQPSRPVQQPSRPFEQPSRPVQQPSRPYQQPSRPVQQPSRPFQQPSRPEPQPPRPVYQQPQPLPQLPQKLKTSVEVVPVPLTYIAPPPLLTHAHLHASHSHTHYTHAHVKVPKHVHFRTYIPKKTKIIIRPARIHAIRVPARLVAYKPLTRRSGPRYPQNALRSTNPAEREPTTFRPLNRPITKPPRL